MLSKDPAISVRGMSKAYTIQGGGYERTTLVETALRKLRHPLRRTGSETFWALKDVSFNVYKGDVVGLVGRNGSGKSTLLKIISRITEPTTGEIDLYGRVGSLLEVGTGFHPELTGRENIFLNGAILGMTKAEIRRQFDAIIDFAGIEKFLDTPVKRYSSGMYVRLAFAVAAHLQTEILIVDEVLAVGDAEFQKKCLGKMKDAGNAGRTVLFVSHNLSAVRTLCTKAMFLVNGTVQAISDPATVISSYLQETERARYDRYEGSRGLVLSDPGFLDDAGADAGTVLHFGSNYQLTMKVSCPEPLTAALSVTIFDDEGLKISSIQSIEEGCDYWDLSKIERITCELPKLSLAPGNYLLSISFLDGYAAVLTAENAVRFTVEPRTLGDSPLAYTKSHGVCRIARGVWAS